MLSCGLSGQVSFIQRADAHAQNSWRKPEPLPQQNSENHHKGQTAQKQGRKIWFLDRVMVEQTEGGETGNPNPEKTERAQKTPCCLAGKGAVYLCTGHSALYPKASFTF